MQYTIKGQVSLSLLDNNLHVCAPEHATYQFEIYTTYKGQKIGMVNPFNNNQFTHPIDSNVKFTPNFTVNGVLLSKKQIIQNIPTKNKFNQR